MPPARAPRRKGGWLSLLLVGATASWLIFLRTRQLGARRGPATPPPPPPAPEALPAPPPPTPPPTRGPPVLRCSTTRGPFAVELDPALCPNSAAQLSALGFETLINLKRDFYADIENGRTPSHHVLLTNPPYSGEHREKLFSYILDSYAPQTLLPTTDILAAHIQP